MPKYRIDNLPKNKADELAANLRGTIMEQINAAENFIVLARKAEKLLFLSEPLTSGAREAWKLLADGLSEYDRARLAIAEAANARVSEITEVK